MWHFPQQGHQLSETAVSAWSGHALRTKVTGPLVAVWPHSPAEVTIPFTWEKSG